MAEEPTEASYLEARIAAHTKRKHRSNRPCPDCRLAFLRWRVRGGAFAEDQHPDPQTEYLQLQPPIPEVKKIG